MIDLGPGVMFRCSCTSVKTLSSIGGVWVLKWVGCGVKNRELAIGKGILYIQQDIALGGCVTGIEWAWP